MSVYERFKSFKAEQPKQEVVTTKKEASQEITADNLPLDFVKQYLRVDHNFDDVEIQVHINSARAYVKTYIKQPADEPLDDGLIAPILTLTAYFYENKSPQMKSTEKLDITFGNILNLHRRDII